MKNNPGQIWCGAPKLGQDNEDILEELGYSNEEIEQCMPRERLERRNNYMDFSFTEEQELLAENLVEFMDREYPESLIKECDEQKIFPVEAK